MKKRKFVSWFLLFMFIFSMSFASILASAAPKEIALNKKSICMKKGQKYTLKLKGVKKKKIKWSSNNKKIASVRNGVVKAKKTGRCMITAKYQSKKYKCTIYVKKAKTNNSNTNISRPKQTPEPTQTVGSIHMSVKSDEVDNKKLLITIYNERNTEAVTGMDFSLEKLENGEWKKLDFKENTAFLALAMIVPANGNATQNISLENYFDNLTKGNYRISKQIYSNNSQYIVYAEFVLA